MRLYLFGLIILAGFALLVWRLWIVQIENYRRYVSALPETQMVKQRVPGIRGEIKDRNGIPLAINRISYEIKLDLKEIRRLYEEHHKDIPKVSFRAKDSSGIERVREEPDIFKMYDKEIKPQLESLGLAAPVNAEEMRRHYRTNAGVIPFTYRKEVPFEEIAIVAEQSQYLQGVTISRRPIRHYPYGAMMGHILGYTRQTGDMEVPESDRKKYSFYEGDDIGVEGLEKTLDEELQGRAGLRVYPKNEHGRLIYEEIVEQRREPVKGSDIYLTIDARMQYVAEMALREAGIGRGSAVVLDPNNGDILAMAAVPSYDPNRFVPEIDPEEWNKLRDDETAPLLNRSIAAYPPGSTFKLPVALAGCVSKQGKRVFNCDGATVIGNHPFHCWTVKSRAPAHGNIGLSDAIMHSCNCYFYQYGLATGIKNIDRVTRWFGLGEKSGIELPHESAGNIPNPKMLAITSGRPWTDADTVLTSIGQGEVLCSPLQIANVSATVANGGICYRPRLVQRRYDYADHSEIAYAERIRHNLIEDGAEPASIELVRKGMWKVVHGERGTGKKARQKSYETAGKTGSATSFRRNEKNQRVEDHKTWFTCFAPYDKPMFAVCVMVENGKSGGGTSAPVASRILKQCFAIKNGSYQPPLSFIPPATGHFDPILEVTYADDPVDAAIAASSAIEEAITDGPETSSTRPPKKSNIAAPKLKTRADAEGSNVRNQDRSSSRPKHRQR